MFDAFLVPEKTTVTAKGDGAPLDVSAASNPIFLLTLSITDVVEQESIELTLFTSADGTTWDAKPAATLPQKVLCGRVSAAGGFVVSGRREIPARALGSKSLGTRFHDSEV